MTAAEPHDEGALARAQSIRAALPEGGLFHEKSWRVSPDAFPVDPGFAARLDQLGFQLLKFLRACDALYLASARGKQPAWIAGLLDRGKPAWLIELARDPASRGALPPVIRPDLVLTEGGFILSEIDSVPGGIGLTAWLAETYAAAGADVVGGPTGMLDGFAAAIPSGDIAVSEEAATYRPEMEWLASRLNARVADGAGAPRWRVVGTDPRDDWAPAVYRFFELFDLANVAACGQLAEGVRARSISVLPPFKAHLEEKLWFALFWMKPLEAFWVRELGGRTFAALREVIPYSWLVDPTPLPPHAVLPGLEAHSWDDVAALSQKERDLVLKISGFHETGWGARGVTVGQDVPASGWQSALRHALESFETHPFVLQRFHKGRLVRHRWLDPDSGKIVTSDGRVRLCPYYFATGERVRCAGALATICPPDKKLLHGMSDAILVPAAVSGDPADPGRS